LNQIAKVTLKDLTRVLRQLVEQASPVAGINLAAKPDKSRKEKAK
jgi:predicted Zn-dependent peptidase